MKKALLLTLLAACCTYGAGRVLAQNKTIDSLTRVLKTAKEDTNKVNVLNALSQKAGWRIGNFDTALYFALSAEQLSEKLDFKRGIAKAYHNFGIISYYRGDYSGSLKNLFTARKIYKAIGDKHGIATVCNAIGSVYCYQGNFSEALKSYFTSLKFFEAIGNKRGMAALYNNIGGIYSSENNDTIALKYYLKALAINKKSGNKNYMAKNYANIGIIYEGQGNYSKALENYYTALKLDDSLKAKGDEIGNYVGIGNIYLKQDKTSKALKYGFTALKLSKSLGSKLQTATAYGLIGRAYIKLNKTRNGKEWLRKGLDLSKAIGTKTIIQSAYLTLASADSALGNYKSAFENYKLYTVYKDSLFNEANTKKITQTAMQYEFDKKQLADSLQNVQVRKLAAEKLQKQKAYTGMGAGLVVLLLAFSGLIFRNNKKLSKEKQKSEGLLHNILPEEVSKDLKERGATTAHEFDHVTVLFTDFVNFTIAGEKMSPTELVEELHHCFKAFDEIIGKYHIEKIKTVGDAYLAVSGLPEPDEQHATHIVKAATEIRGFMLERRQQLGDKTFEVRIGIHSGSVVAGIVGIKKFAYDIWGDTVNTASRMEQNSEPGKINISETTYQLVKDDFNCAYRGEIAAKNKGKLKMYFVEKATA